MTSFKRRLWKWTAAFVATLLILLAIGVGLFRVAVPMVPALRADAEQMAQEALGWPVHIGAIDLRWALLGPELVLTDVQLLAPQTRQPLVSAAQLDIAFGPLDFLREGPPRPSHIRLHRPTLALERGAEGELFLSGYALPAATGSTLDWRELLELGLRHGRLTILEGELHYRDVSHGIDDWTVQLPRVSAASDGNDHEIEGLVVPPGALGEQLAFAFAAEGQPGRPEAWRWTLELGVRELRLDWWYQQFRWAGAGQLAGELDVAAKLAGDGAGAWSGAGQVALSNFGFAGREPVAVAPGQVASSPLGNISFEWRVRRDVSLAAVDVTELAIEHEDSRFTDGTISVRLGGEPYPLEIAAARLPLDELAAFVALLPADSETTADGLTALLARVRAVVQRLQPHGRLHEMILGVDPGAQPLAFRVESAFENLGVEAWGEWPGVRGLSGSLRGERAAGRVTVDSRNVVLDTGGLFRQPLPVERLSGTLRWSADANGWRLRSNDLAVENPEASVQAQFELALPADAPAEIDMTAIARNVDFRARSRWLPAAVMSDALVAWLDRGVLAGHAPEARMTLRGPLANFPFRDGSGVFDIRFRAEDTVVDYAPGWPRATALSADVHFSGPGLVIDVDHARLGDALVVNDAKAQFGDFRDARLEIDAAVEGRLEGAWEFLGASPLRGRLSGVLDALQVSGPLTADVELDIPLKDVDATEVVVEAALADATVSPTALPWPIESLHGELRVTRRDIVAERLRGVFAGEPFAVSIVSGAPVADGFAPVRIPARGRMPVAALHEVLPAAWLERLEGGFDWHGELAVPGDDSAVAITLAGDLGSVRSSLPAPLDALPAATAEIAVLDNAVDVSLRAADLGSALLRFAEGARGWHFERGRVTLGGEVSGLPAQTGLFIDGAAGRLDADGWLSFEGGGEGDPLLSGFSLRARALEFVGLVIADQSVAGRRQGAGWELLADGPVAGTISVPGLDDVEQPWRLDLDRLHLPLPEAAGDGEREIPDPRELPPLTVEVRDLRVGELAFGHVSGAIERTAIGYTVRGLTARAPSFALTLDGRWEYVEGGHYTSLTAALESTDIGDTLGALGYGNGIDADEGHIEANLAWHAAPFEFDRALVEGSAGFRFEDGSLREVNPGAGRLLGLLSIAALPRRLLLDFSDFFGEGLHFDRLGGDFLITDGNAYTTNVRLEGPSVSALLVGRTGLVARDYDQVAIVDPDVSASIPVAGYLAAGPSVGAALLLLSQILKAPLSDITQVKYRITGSWDEPVIERIQQGTNAQRNENRN